MGLEITPDGNKALGADFQAAMDAIANKQNGQAQVAADRTDAANSTVDNSALHKSTAVKADALVGEFKKALTASPDYDFDGSKYTPAEQALLAKIGVMVEAQEATIDLNLSDNPKAEEVHAKVLAGLGKIPDEYKSFVSDMMVRALKDNPEIRDRFQELIRFAKTSSVLMQQAKDSAMDEAATKKLANLLKQVEPFEGVFAALFSAAASAAAKLDLKTIFEVFNNYNTDLETILKPLLEKHLPKDKIDSGNNLTLPAQVQPGLQAVLTEYAEQIVPVANKVTKRLADYMKTDAEPLSRVLANGIAAFSTVADKFRALFKPKVMDLATMLKVKPEHVPKDPSLN